MAPALKSRARLLAAYVFHGRYQVVMAMMAVLLGPLFRLRGGALFRNLTDVTASELVYVALSLTVFSVVVLFTTRLLVANGPARFGLEMLVPDKLPWLFDCAYYFGGSLVLGLPTYLVLLDTAKLSRLFEMGQGVLLGWSVLTAAVAFERWILPPGPANAAVLPDLPILHWLERRVPVKALVGVELTRRRTIVASVFLMACVSAYIVVGLLTSADSPRNDQFPALAYLYILLTVACFVLTGLAYLFDPYYVPVVLVIGGMVLWASAALNTGHVLQAISYTSRHRSDPASLMPSKLLRRELWKLQASGRAKDPIVIVASSGGGISASAWTASVLVGLDSAVGQQAFSHSVSLISSVSGGSVGTMYFANAYDHGRLDPSKAREVVTAAASDSLNAVGWGLAYPDPWRFLLEPIFGLTYEDRGWAQEQAWKRRVSNAKAIEEPLSAWREDVAEGLRPAVIFNATVAEEGGRMLFSTVDVPDQLWKTRSILRYGRPICGADVSVVTAARASAAFPYVGPIAGAVPPSSRCDDTLHDTDWRTLHFADGGYFDNGGVMTAVQWLDTALSGSDVVSELRARPRDILFVRISTVQSHDPCREVDSTETATETSRTPAGGFYSLFGPATTMLNVRNFSQATRDKAELDWVISKWKDVVHIEDMPVNFPVIERDESQSPLSWRLTPAERRGIQSRWNVACARLAQCGVLAREFSVKELECPSPTGHVE